MCLGLCEESAAEALPPRVVAEFHCRGLWGGEIQPSKEPFAV